MRLLIDAGNTRIKWALVAAADPPGTWASFGSVSTADHGQLEAAWAALSITDVLASNVAGDALRERILGALEPLGVRGDAVRWFRALSHCAGVKNGYAQPEQLGSDRFASLIGARYRFPGERLLIVTCGTAKIGRAHV